MNFYLFYKNLRYFDELVSFEEFYLENFFDDINGFLLPNFKITKKIYIFYQS